MFDGLFSGSVGALLSGASSALNSALSYGYSKKMARLNAELQYSNQKRLMKHQYQYNQQSLVESPSAVKSGLVQAGFNPMLAISDATNAPTVGLGSAGMPGASVDFGVGDLGAAFDRAANSAVQRKEQKKEIEKMDKLTDAELDKLEAEADAALAHSGAAMYNAETNRLEAEARIDKTKKEADSIAPEARYVRDYAGTVKDVATPIASAYGAKKGAEVATKMMSKAGIKNAAPYARAATSSAVANSAKGAAMLGSRFVPAATALYGISEGFKGRNTEHWKKTARPLVQRQALHGWH